MAYFDKYDVEFSDDKKTLVRCSKDLKGEYSIPSSVSVIEKKAFWGCKNLTSVAIPNGVTSIGRDAFRCCAKLTSIDIPNSVTSIGDSAFFLCVDLTNATIGNGVTSIGEYAFSNCPSLTSVSIGNSVTSIGDSAFEGCEVLEKIEIPNSVICIGKYAFKKCSKLNYVHIPASVSKIGEKAFTDCTYFSIAEDNKTYDSRENCNAIIETSSDTLIQGNANTIIPYGVKHIGNMAFQGCSLLRQINIPTSIISIGDFAFARCSMLEHIELPDTITKIGSFAFAGIENLTSIIIPNGMKTISEGSFTGCKNLQNISLPSTITHIEYSAFADCINLKSIKIPNGVVQIGANETPILYKMVDGDHLEPFNRGVFSGCVNLNSIEIPESTAFIGAYTFANCVNLSSLTIYNGEIEIGKNAFENCESLEEIQVPADYEKRFYYMKCFDYYRDLFYKTYHRNTCIRSIILAFSFIVDIVVLFYIGIEFFFKSAYLLSTMLCAPFLGFEEWLLKIFMFALGLIGLPVFGCIMTMIAGVPLMIGNEISNSITKDNFSFNDAHVFVLMSVAILLAFGAVFGLNISEFYNTPSFIIAIITIIIAAISPIIGYAIAKKH